STSSHREFRLQAQAIPSYCNSLRQDRQKLPRRYPFGRHCNIAQLRTGPSTTLADFERAGDSQISFSVTHGWSAFGGADHGWQDVELGRGAWTLSDAVSGSV